MNQHRSEIGRATPCSVDQPHRLLGIFRASVVTGVALAALTAPAMAQPVFDHLKCYKVKDEHKFKGVVDLSPVRFGDSGACQLKIKASYFCLPAVKGEVRSTDVDENGDPIPYPELPVSGESLTTGQVCYKLKCKKPFPADTSATDQFGNRALTKPKPKFLCAPAVPLPSPPPSSGTDDHLQCYKVKDDLKAKATATVTAQLFGPTEDCSVTLKARSYCVPATKTVLDDGGAPAVMFGGPTLSNDQLCYKVKCDEDPADVPVVTDQFGSRAMTKLKPALLCAPAFPPTACAHDKCQPGDPLDAACDPCVAQVCATDPSCCTVTWDDHCMGLVGTVCFETCPPTCGDGTVNQASEECDLLDNGVCAGASCLPDCTCDEPCVNVGGACWRMSQVGESCYDACLEIGYSYDPATDSFAGANGTNANCDLVADALGDSGPPAATGVCGDAIGCAFSEGLRARCSNNPTTSHAFVSNASRACACQLTTTCGDNIQGPGEDCDGAGPDAGTCGGATYCSSECHCLPPPFCCEGSVASVAACGYVDDPTDCSVGFPGASFSLGPESSQCDSITGSCQNAPPSASNCCEAAGYGTGCFAGPAALSHCSFVGGTHVGAAACREDGTCAVRPNIVFVTSQAFDGNLGHVEGATNTCNALASAAGLTGSFKPWLSQYEDYPAVSPQSTFTNSVQPYHRTDGAKVADDWADLSDGGLYAPINHDENGDPTPYDGVWTNTDADGTFTNKDTDCQEWTKAEETYRGSVGQTFKTDASWTTSGFLANCAVELPIYCFEQ